MKSKIFTLLFWTVGIINIVLFAVNLLYVCHFYPTKKPIEFDYYGIIVSILSFLVSVLAILLGYNIFSLEKNIDKSVDKKKDEFRKEMENSISDAKCQLYYTASLVNKESGQPSLEFHNLFLSANESQKNKITNDEEKELIIKRIIEIISNKEYNTSLKFRKYSNNVIKKG